MSDSRWNWPRVVDSFLVLYLLWLSYTLTRRASVFGGLFTALGAQVPPITAAILRLSSPPIPYAVAVLMAVGLILKNRAAINDTGKLAISLIFIVVTSAWQAIVHEALFRPMLQLIEAINR